MATSYHVSDCLENRHPYDHSTGFLEQQKRDRHKLFKGFGLPSLQFNIQALPNLMYSVENKTEIMKNILNLMSSPEIKIRTIEFGLVSSLKWLISQNINATMDELACNAFRSLAMVPLCLRNIYENEGVPSVLTVLAGRKDSKSDQGSIGRAQEAACEALREMTFSWNARALLWGEGDLTGTPNYSMSEVPEDYLNQPNLKLGSQVVEALVGIIAQFNSNRSNSIAVLRLAVQCLVSLSSDMTGLLMCLKYNFLHESEQFFNHYFNEFWTWVKSQDRITADVLHQLHQTKQELAMEPDRSSPGATINFMVAAVWNVCMDQQGKRKPECVSALPLALGKLLLALSKYPTENIALKAAITGAIAAIYIQEDAKPSALKPLVTSVDEAASFGITDLTSVDITQLLIDIIEESRKLLKSISARTVDVAKSIAIGKSEEKILNELSALLKNSVQAVRLISELPYSRSRISHIIGPRTELCGQIFKTTSIEIEMMAAADATLKRENEEEVKMQNTARRQRAMSVAHEVRAFARASFSMAT